MCFKLWDSSDPALKTEKTSEATLKQISCACRRVCPAEESDAIK